MARKTIVVFCLVAGLALAGCSRTPQPAEAQPAEAAAEQAAPPADVPQLQGRSGLVRIEDDALRVVRNYTALFYDGELDALHERFSAEFKESMTLELLTELRENVREHYGQELSVVGEQSQIRGEYRGFVRWAKFEKFDGVIELLWILREDDSIAGFFIRPTEPSES